MGGLVVLYTTLGGIKAVTWADVQQMTDDLRRRWCWRSSSAISLLPAGRLVPRCRDARRRGRQAERRRPHASIWNDRYNIWSGLIGGMFLCAGLLRNRPVARCSAI